jgi:hypothetical protein
VLRLSQIRIEPCRFIVFGKDHWHPVMHCPDHAIGLCGNDGVAPDFLLSLGILPDIVEPGKGKEYSPLELEVMPGKGGFE